jgi:hypothetical protein
MRCTPASTFLSMRGGGAAIIITVVLLLQQLLLLIVCSCSIFCEDGQNNPSSMSRAVDDHLAVGDNTEEIRADHNSSLVLSHDVEEDARCTIIACQSVMAEWLS